LLCNKLIHFSFTEANHRNQTRTTTLPSLAPVKSDANAALQSAKLKTKIRRSNLQATARGLQKSIQLRAPVQPKVTVKKTTITRNQ